MSGKFLDFGAGPFAPPKAEVRVAQRQDSDGLTVVLYRDGEAAGYTHVSSTPIADNTPKHHEILGATILIMLRSNP